MERIIHGMSPGEALAILRRADGYYVTNTARDLSQSDYKNRILLNTDLLAAKHREQAGYFSLEITGGASIHVDILRKQVDPFLKLELLREKMPKTMFQTLCRGINLFGYRPYPQNVIRLVVREFAKYVDVWRVFDFLNHVSNMIAVFEEVQRAGKILEPSLCFSTGPEHTDEYYLKKVGEILDVTGSDVVLCFKNHGGLGTPKRIGNLVDAVLQQYPDLIIHYHGHNTDSNDIGRITAAVRAGAKIIDASDHALSGFYGPPPVLTAVHTLNEYGYKAVGIDEEAVIATSEALRGQRKYYEYFESQFKGFDPTVQIHKLPGGAAGSSFEQATKGGFLEQVPAILHRELPKVQRELGNFWSVTPGSQILWTTAISHVQSGERYANPSGDLKNLLLGKYGPFPFYQPPDWIYEKVFGDQWREILREEGGMDQIADMDIEQEYRTLADKLGYEPTQQQLVSYLQHPNDTVAFFKFEEKFGKVYVLPPGVFFRRGGFKLGEIINFRDHYGKEHVVEIGPMQRDETGKTHVYLNVDHHERRYEFEPEEESGVQACGVKAVKLNKQEINKLAKIGDIRAPFGANVCEVEIKIGDQVKVDDRLLILEAMKMQTPINSQVAGKVESIAVKVGSAVKPGDELVKIIVT
ncbi:MAG: pyruvate carboxylase [Desulfobulbaceae bacterium]|nr:MAG: pyruvate carboxylase [Desulfobulbaceae bacterium]